MYKKHYLCLGLLPHYDTYPASSNFRDYITKLTIFYLQQNTVLHRAHSLINAQLLNLFVTFSIEI